MFKQEKTALSKLQKGLIISVGATGFEPVTLCL
jgi:hypothetical protein